MGCLHANRCAANRFARVIAGAGTLTFSTLVVRYSVFAALATIANLAAQRFVLLSLDANLAFAVAAGTGLGLVTKYTLDKKWIFHDALRSAKQETRKFSLYTLTGVGTTLIFWGSETAFWLVGQTQFMRELGAVLGLAAGYVIKFNLDRRFVFRKPAGKDVKPPER